MNSTARSAAGSPVGYPSQASPPPRSKTGDSSGRFARHVFLSSHSFAVRDGVARYFLDCFAGAAAVGTAANTTYGVSITSCPGGNGRRGFRGEGPGWARPLCAYGPRRAAIRESRAGRLYSSSSASPPYPRAFRLARSWSVKSMRDPSPTVTERESSSSFRKPATRSVSSDARSTCSPGSATRS